MPDAAAAAGGGGAVLPSKVKKRLRWVDKIDGVETVDGGGVEERKMVVYEMRKPEQGEEEMELEQKEVIHILSKREQQTARPAISSTQQEQHEVPVYTHLEEHSQPVIELQPETLNRILTTPAISPTQQEQQEVPIYTDLEEHSQPVIQLLPETPNRNPPRSQKPRKRRKFDIDISPIAILKITGSYRDLVTGNRRSRRTS